MNTPLIPEIGDSHFHILEMQSKGLTPLQDLKYWFESGFSYLLDVGVDLYHWEIRVQAAQEFPNLFLGVGYHPHCPGISGFIPDWDTYLTQALHGKTIALGEMGLDYHRGKEHKKSQINLFQYQLGLANTLKKPVILHNRDSDEDLLAVLKEANLPAKGVFHCFSSGIETAKNALDLGYYISFAGNMTYPSAQILREALSYVPVDRILVETDSPYLAPIPYRGKTNSPPLVQETLKKAAEIKSMDVTTLAHQIKNNFKTLFNLPEL